VPPAPAEPQAPAEPIVPAEPAAPIVPPTPPTPPNATLDAGLAAAAATTTETAPPAAVPTWGEPFAEPTARRSRTGLVVASAVVALLLLAGFLLAGPVGDWRHAARLESRRDDALADARRLALNIGSIDYKNLDRDLTRISDSTTGKAREEFDAKILKNDAYKTLVKENQAVLASTIQRIGLEPCGGNDKACKAGDKVVALVFLDQESKNKLRPTPRIDRNRVALTLVRRGRTWLISDVAVL
jgi:Mce-associated membrane protein